jgi:hypothetical protein
VRGFEVAAPRADPERFAILAALGAVIRGFMVSVLPVAMRFGFGGASALPYNRKDGLAETSPWLDLSCIGAGG